MPNVPETAIAMLATTAIGGVWTAASPAFGARTVIDRFAQLTPKLLFVVDGYRFAGDDFSRETQVAEIFGCLPRIEHVVCFPYLLPQRAAIIPGSVSWAAMIVGRTV